MPNRIWTKEEDEIIIRERAARTAVPAIAALLSRPVPATYLRARKLGTLVQPHKPATDDEKRVVRELAGRDPPATDNEIAAAIGRSPGSVRWLLQVMGLINTRDFSAMIRHANKGRAPGRAVADKQAMASTTALNAARREAARLEKEKGKKEAAAARTQLAADRKVVRERLAAEARATRQQQAAARKVACLRLTAEAKKAERQQVEQARAEKAAARAADRARLQAERAAEAAQVRAAREEARRQEKAAKEQAKGLARTEKAAAKAASSIAAVVQAHCSLNTVRIEQPSPAATPTPIVVYDPASMNGAASAEPAVLRPSGRGGWKHIFGTHRRLPRVDRARSRADDLALAEAAKDAIASFVADRGVTRKVESPVELAIRKLRARGYTILGNGKGYTIDARHHLSNDNELLCFAEKRGAA